MPVETIAELESYEDENTTWSMHRYVETSHSKSDPDAKMHEACLTCSQTHARSVSHPRDLDAWFNVGPIRLETQPTYEMISSRQAEQDTGWDHDMARKALSLVWKIQISAATKQEEVIAVIRLFGLNSIASRLTYLHELVADDPDEKPIKLKSLRGLALFIMSNRQLPDPQIGVSPDGFAHAEWRIVDHGILVMEFLPSDVIRFAAILPPSEFNEQRWSINGMLPSERMMDAIQPFTDRLVYTSDRQDTL